MPTTSIRGALSVMARAAWCTAVRATAPATPEMSASLMVFDMINLVATLVPWKLGVGSWKLGVGSWELTRSFPASDPLPLARRAAAESECRSLEAFRMRFRFVFPFLAMALFVVQQGAPSAQQPAPAQPAKPDAGNTYASTYRPFPSRATVIRNATILTAAGPIIERGAILIENGKISAVGQ